jgi:hypothetical protein
MNILCALFPRFKGAAIWNGSKERKMGSSGGPVKSASA